jgi:hypothetical protein
MADDFSGCCSLEQASAPHQLPAYHLLVTYRTAQGHGHLAELESRKEDLPVAPDRMLTR